MRKRVWNGKYEIHSKNSNSAIVELSYDCPYCGINTGEIHTIYPESYDLLESGGFYENLKCVGCGKEAEVMFR